VNGSPPHQEEPQSPQKLSPASPAAISFTENDGKEKKDRTAPLPAKLFPGNPYQLRHIN
jgi:hypothetical protein